MEQESGRVYQFPPADLRVRRAARAAAIVPSYAGASNPTAKSTSAPTEPDKWALRHQPETGVRHLVRSSSPKVKAPPGTGDRWASCHEAETATHPFLRLVGSVSATQTSAQSGVKFEPIGTGDLWAALHEAGVEPAGEGDVPVQALTVKSVSPWDRWAELHHA